MRSLAPTKLTGSGTEHNEHNAVIQAAGQPSMHASINKATQLGCTASILTVQSAVLLGED